jgi:hypothetical protein
MPGRSSGLLAGMISCHLSQACSILKAPLAVAGGRHAAFIVIVIDTENHGVGVGVGAAPVDIVRSKEDGPLNGDERLEGVDQRPPRH